MVQAWLIVCCLLQGQTNHGIKPTDVAQVEIWIQAGELQAAASKLEEALGVEDRDFTAHLLLGLVRQRQGRSEDSLHEFELAHELRPSDPAPYVDMGNVLVTQGKPDQATEEFRDAIRVDSRNQSAHRNLGMLHLQQKQMQQAIFELKEAVKLDPKDAGSWFALLQAELVMGDFQSARQAANHVGLLVPASSEMFRSVGAAQASAGDYQGAIPNLQRAVAAAHDSSDAQYNLSLALLRNNQADKSLPLLLSLRDRQDSAEVENTLGDAYEDQGKWVDAVRAYQRATQLDPANEDYTYDYMNELLKHKSFDAALLIGKAAATNFPNSLRLQLAWSAADYGKGNLLEAHARLVNASSQFPDSSMPLYLRSMIAGVEGRPDTPLLAQARDYIARHPGDSTAWLVLGRAQAQDHPEDALVSFNQCLEIKDSRAECHFDAGKIYFNRNDWQKAAKHLSRSVELNPRLTQAWYRLALACYRQGQKQDGDTAMRAFKTLQAADKSKSEVNTFLYTLR